MSEQPNTRWRSHVNSLAARILEESGYRTDRDFAPVKIQELLANASINYYDVENLLCGLYTEANRWREQIDHKPNYRISAKKLKRRLRTICENAGFLEHPEWLAEISVGDFLEIEGLDEVTIPDLLLELTFTVQEMKDRQAGRSEPTFLPSAALIHDANRVGKDDYIEEDDWRNPEDDTEED